MPLHSTPHQLWMRFMPHILQKCSLTHSFCNIRPTSYPILTAKQHLRRSAAQLHSILNFMLSDIHSFSLCKKSASLSYSKKLNPQNFLDISYALFYHFLTIWALPQSYDFLLFIISQYPLLGEPWRIKMPFSFSFLMFASTFLPAMPSCLAIFAAERYISTDKSSKILICVSFKSALNCSEYFSDASDPP